MHKSHNRVSSNLDYGSLIGGRTMRKYRSLFLAVIFLFAMGLFFIDRPIAVAAATCSCCKCNCCNCGCGCSGSCSCSGKGQVQPAQPAPSEDAIKAETRRVTDAHMQEDNRSQFNGYMMKLADAFKSSAENSGFTVNTQSWKTATGGDHYVVQQEFSRKGWTLKIQYRFNGNGFMDECHPVWLSHNGNQINSGEEWGGWSWSTSQTIYELLDMLSKI